MKRKYVVATGAKKHPKAAGLQAQCVRMLRKQGFTTIRTVLGAHIMRAGTFEVICTRNGSVRESRNSISMLDFLGSLSSILRHQMRHPIRALAPRK